MHLVDFGLAFQFSDAGDCLIPPFAVVFALSCSRRIAMKLEAAGEGDLAIKFGWAFLLFAPPISFPGVFKVGDNEDGGLNFGDADNAPFCGL